MASLLECSRAGARYKGERAQPLRLGDNPAGASLCAGRGSTNVAQRSGWLRSPSSRYLGRWTIVRLWPSEEKPDRFRKVPNPVCRTDDVLLGC